MSRRNLILVTILSLIFADSVFGQIRNAGRRIHKPKSSSNPPIAGKRKIKRNRGIEVENDETHRTKIRRVKP